LNFANVMVDLFDGFETPDITFNVKIIAKKKVEQEITCRKDRMVWEFMKDISMITELFEELDLESGLFWPYIETEQDDIPLEFDMPMSRVQHLLLFVNLCEPKNELKLVVRLRIFSVR